MAMRMLCAGLQWLGGTEEALDTCKLLNGTWRDHYGSLYEVRATLTAVHVVMMSLLPLMNRAKKLEF